MTGKAFCYWHCASRGHPGKLCFLIRIIIGDGASTILSFFFGFFGPGGGGEAAIYDRKFLFVVLT